MGSPDLRMAADVLRNNAPRYSHEVRHACFAAASLLEGIVFDPDDPVAVSVPVKNKHGRLIGHAQMMLSGDPTMEHHMPSISSWFTAVEID